MDSLHVSDHGPNVAYMANYTPFPGNPGPFLSRNDAVHFSSDGGASFRAVPLAFSFPEIMLDDGAATLGIMRDMVFGPDGVLYVFFMTAENLGFPSGLTYRLKLLKVQPDGSTPASVQNIAVIGPGITGYDPLTPITSTLYEHNGAAMYLDTAATDDAVWVIFSPGETYTHAGGQTNKLHQAIRIDTTTGALAKFHFGHSPRTGAPPQQYGGGATSVPPSEWAAMIDTFDNNIVLAFPATMHNDGTGNMVNYRVIYMPDSTQPFPDNVSAFVNGGQPAYDVRFPEPGISQVETAPLMLRAPGSTASSFRGGLHHMVLRRPAGTSSSPEVELVYVTPDDQFTEFRTQLGGEGQGHTFKTARFDPTSGNVLSGLQENREDFGLSFFAGTPWRLRLNSRRHYSSFYGIDAGVSLATFCQQAFMTHYFEEYGFNLHLLDVS